jgi:hypothetical protein
LDLTEENPLNSNQKRKVVDILAENLNWLMTSFPALHSTEMLEAKSGVGRSTIARIRQSESSATIDTVESLAKAFGLNASDLLKDRMAINPDIQKQIVNSRILAIAAKLGSLSDEKIKAVESLLDIVVQ